MQKFKDKNILFITHAYSTFQKSQIEVLSNYFKQVYVIVRYKPIAELSRIIPISGARMHTYKVAFDLKNKPENVEVLSMPLWYLPLDVCYENLGDYHFKQTMKIVNRFNIQFDIIHAHFTWTAGYAGVKLGQCYSKPVLITVHENNDRLLGELNSGNKGITYTLKNADCIIRVNRNTMGLLQKYNDNVVYVPNGFADALFKKQDTGKAREQTKLPPNSKILLNVASLDDKKGQEYLIEAIAILKREGIENILCLIIGEGPLKKKLEKKIKRLGLMPNVKLLGFIPPHELGVYMNSCDLFVLPSISESFGIVQLEAMACGKPVVATINGGSEEIITADVGLLCNKREAHDLAEKIKLALNRNWDTDLIISYAGDYKWEKICSQILELYGNVLDQKKIVKNAV